MENVVVDTINLIGGADIHFCLACNVTGCGTDKCSLSKDKGGLYGFAIKLPDDKERERFFNEHNANKKMKHYDDWKTIGDDYYPLYWGKDADLGFRLREHIKFQQSAPSIGLDLRPYLKGKKIICGALFCYNRKRNEDKLHSAYPDIFKVFKGI